MTIFRTSAPVERSFMRDKQWQHPGRREFIHGRIQDDLPKMNRLWFWMRFVIMGTVTVYALKLAVVG